MVLGEKLTCPKSFNNRAFALDENIVISIKDNGPGIPVDKREKIFGPFFTTKDIGLGTGLGLSVILNIVMRLGETLELNTEVGEFAEFIMTFPVSN